MKLVSYGTKQGVHGEWRPGVVVDDVVIDAFELGRHLWPDASPSAYASVRGILTLGKSASADLALAVRSADRDLARPVDDLVLGPPVPDPQKILCLGLNYREHAEESKMELPAAPILFAKFRNSLIGAGAPIIAPAISQKVDFEGELAVVIGERCKHVPASEAHQVIAGYMALNDVSARDLQLQTTQWTAGKAVDSFAPCGPWLVTADEVGDPQALDLTTRVNGEVMQQSNTSLMIFSIAQTLAFISSLITLDVGDIVATGTPAGVGASRTPPIFLEEGDDVEVEISEIGVLRNPVIREAATPEHSGARSDMSPKNARLDGLRSVMPK